MTSAIGHDATAQILSELLGRDVPVVWQGHAPTANIIDGNHRMTAAVLEGQLFQQVRRIDLHNMGGVVRQTAKVRAAQGQARVKHGTR